MSWTDKAMNRAYDHYRRRHTVGVVGPQTCRVLYCQTCKEQLS